MTGERPEDFLDVFEPWSERGVEVAFVPAPPSMRRPRRLSPRHALGASATPPSPEPGPPPVSSPEAAEATGSEAAPGALPESPAPPAEVPAPPDPRVSPAAYLRKVAIPEIQRLGRRLKAAGHHTRIQDLLDLPEPSLRVLFWPHLGPLASDSPATRGTLEIGVAWGDAPGLEGDRPRVARSEGARVRARYWISTDGSVPVMLRATTLDHLDTGWVRNRFLDFVEIVLSGL